MSGWNAAASSALDRPASERCMDARTSNRSGAIAGRTVALQGIGQWVRRIEPAQRETGVGHGWLGAAAPIARGPRLGSGAPRTDSKRAPLVDSRDTAAARADRLDQNRGKRDGHTGNRFGALGDGDATSD